ncbi:MAG: glutamine synthetase family protein [Candidatus Thorarchaeota archaeon]|jgi:glutamine synthetase
MRETHDRPDFLRLLFSTVLGATKSIEIAYEDFDDVMKNGVYFDGSSVPGYASVNSSDLLLKPRSSRPLFLPWEKDVAVLVCGVFEAPGDPHPRDPSSVLSRIAGTAREAGFELRVGSELEFFLVKENGRGTIAPGDVGGYFSTLPSDGGLQFRRRVAKSLGSIGISTTTHHHEVAAGQHEVGLRFNSAISAADDIMLARLLIAEMAHEIGAIATFMPKPFSGMNGSGMHLHESLWSIDERANLFSSGKSGEVSELAGSYVAGLLEHAEALAAIVAPTVNSFKRLTPGYEAPTRIAWGLRNRSTMIRIPQYNGSDVKARIEFRCPDPLCSSHLAVAATLAAGLDGIRRGLTPPAPTSENLYKTAAETESLPGSLREALDKLERDDVIVDALGKSLVDTIVKMRTAEWAEYKEITGNPGVSEVTPWEVSKYLRFN